MLNYVFYDKKYALPTIVIRMPAPLADIAAQISVFTVGEEAGQKGAIRAPISRLLAGKVRLGFVVDRMTRGARAPRDGKGRALRHAVSSYKGVSLLEPKSGDELLVAAGTDENSDPPAYVVPKLALMLAVFERTKVAEVEYQPSVGGCEGLLCAAAGEFGAFVALQA